MTLPPEHDPLRRTLAEWRMSPCKDPEFRAAVWARIKAAGRPATWARFAQAHPAAVSGLLAGAVLAGAWSGRTEARQQVEAERTQIAATYVHALDARWMRQP